MAGTALRGRHVLVTAGPTRAPIDRVRYLSNRSTGATGVGVAEALGRAGAVVHLVYGPGHALAPAGVDVVRVETPDEMKRAALEVVTRFPVAAAVLAAAVLDYVPETVRDEKIPSGAPFTIRLVPTPKLIDDLVRAAPRMITVGFKLECGRSDDDLAAVARSFLAAKGLSAVVANDLDRITETDHPALLVTACGGEAEVRPLLGKAAIAEAIVDHLERALSASGAEADT